MLTPLAEKIACECKLVFEEVCETQFALVASQRGVPLKFGSDFYFSFIASDDLWICPVCPRINRDQPVFKSGNFEEPVQQILYSKDWHAVKSMFASR